MSAPRTITRSAFINLLAEGLGLDPDRTFHVRIDPDRIVAMLITDRNDPDRIVAMLITDRNDPDAVIPHEGATPRKTVTINVVEDGGKS